MRAFLRGFWTGFSMGMWLSLTTIGALIGLLGVAIIWPGRGVMRIGNLLIDLGGRFE